MPNDVLTDDQPVTRSRSGAISIDRESVDQKQIDWVLAFTETARLGEEKAEKDKKRNEVVANATLGLRTGKDGLAGLDFTLIVKKDASLFSRMLAVVGTQATMDTLTGTGDAMKEFDTVNDLGSVETVDIETLQKAGESLKLVADASKNLDAALMELYADEFGIDPKDFERLAHARDQRKAEKQDPDKRREAEGKRKERAKNAEAIRNGAPDARSEEEKKEEELDRALVEFEKLRAKVEKDVREEVWTPLVREGLIPENFVPDRRSEVAATFEGASDAYNQRLDEYTKSLGPNAEKIAKLKLGKTIADQTLKVTSAVVDLVPGAKDVKDHIQNGIECANLLLDSSFQVAGMVLQKQDALTITQGVFGAVSGIMGTVGVVPEDVQSYVNTGLEMALTGARAIKGIMDGKPEDVLAAILAGVTQSCALASQVTGNPEIARAGAEAAAGVFLLDGARQLIKVMKTKPVDPKAVQAALREFVKSGMQVVALEVSRVIEAEEARGGLSKSDGDTISQATTIATDGIGGLVDAALSDNKAAALAKAIGGIANDCCSAYIPGDYGALVGGLIKKSLTTAPALVDAIKTKNPDAAFDALSSLLAKSLKLASEVDGMDESLAEGLGDASKAIKAVQGIADFKKAVEAGDVAGVKKAAAKIINNLMDPVLEKIDPDALAGDGTLVQLDDSEDDDTGEADELDPDSELAKERLQDFAAQQRQKIAAAEKIIKDPGAKPEAIEKAKKDRDDAVKALLEPSATADEIAASAKEFEDLLNHDFTGEDGDDDDGDTRTLEKLITTIQRDRMVMQMADSLIGMGIGVAAHFFPPLGIAMDLKTFATEAAKAVAHLQQLLVWKKNAQEARNAVTVQVHAMLNRVGLEQDAMIEHQIKATLALISAIGNIVATAGAHAAPAGIAITAAAKAARASLELALTIKSAAEMEMAWAQYKNALKNPKNRKVVRMAIQKNSTLAKYAQVWGALNDGNPIAQKALKRCGLTDPIIAKEQSNVKGVVQYLEVLYNDDPVVLKAVPDTSGWGWEAPRPELTLRRWTEFLATAQNDGKPKLQSGAGGAITAAFAPVDRAKADLAKAVAAKDRMEKAYDAVEVAMTQAEIETDLPEREKIAKLKEGGEESPEERRRKKLAANLEAAAVAVEKKQAALIAAYENLVTACKGFKPLDKDGKPYPRVREWIEGLAALAELEVREMRGEDVGLDLAA